MTTDGLVNAIIGLDNLAEASGMSSGDVAFGSLLGALGIGDRNVSGGLSRDSIPENGRNYLRQESGVTWNGS